MQNGRDTNMRKRANIDRQGHLLAAHSGGHRVRPGQSHGALTMLEETMSGTWRRRKLKSRPATGSRPRTTTSTPNIISGRCPWIRRLTLSCCDVGRHIPTTEIEAAITSLGREQAGLVLMTDSFLVSHLRTIVLSVTRNNVPAIFDPPSFPREGGLMSYGPNYPDMFRRVAGHIDRILRGVRPADLPVEAPIKFNLVINLKTAATLGLTVPPTLLALADEVIE
jgi:ABC transporter substrate binding protein